MDEQMPQKGETPVPRNAANEYKALGTLLHAVRWSQHLLAIIAEVLILVSFAMSGMDLSLGGVMADIPLLKIFWAGMFALGLDTAFALSWVRVRRHLRQQEWLAFVGNGLLALGMSFVVFQPISIQLLQQSLNLSFDQAVASLGINMVFLTYARSGVAVFLGAILAITNAADEAVPIKRVAVRSHRLAWLRRLCQWLRVISQKQPKAVVPVSVNQELPAQVAIPQSPGGLLVASAQAFAEMPIMTERTTFERVEAPADVADAPTEPLVAVDQAAAEQVTSSEQVAETPKQPTEEPAQPTEVSAQSEPLSYETPEQRAQRVSELDFTGLSGLERVAAVLKLFPNLSDRELGRLSNVSAATAKKYRGTLKRAQLTAQEDR